MVGGDVCLPRVGGGLAGVVGWVGWGGGLDGGGAGWGKGNLNSIDFIS